MKNLLLLFSALTLLLTSCSSDDNNSSEDKSILPKTISFIFPNAQLGTNSIGTLIYEGNKIVSLTREDSKTVYTYDGNSIVKQEQFDLSSQGTAIKNKEVEYTYEKGKLKTRLFKIFQDGDSKPYLISKTVYTHTSDVLVNYVNYSSSGIKEGEGSFEFKNGNIIKEIQISGTLTTTTTHEYDAKNNPLKNIAGFNLLLNEIDGFGNNNITKTTRVMTEYPNPSVYLQTYIYNENGYPAKATSFDGGGISVEYEREYTY